MAVPIKIAFFHCVRNLNEGRLDPWAATQLVKFFGKTLCMNFMQQAKWALIWEDYDNRLQKLEASLSEAHMTAWPTCHMCVFLFVWIDHKFKIDCIHALGISQD